MCGIFGFLNQPERYDPFVILDKMSRRTKHRGPDAYHSLKEPPYFLGMNRLAIVDLDTGEQPFWNRSKTASCVFNGEIYNHRAIRSDLEENGIAFSSDHADGEVIIKLYNEHGLSFVERLNGMFAIAIYDFSKGKVHLLRDRLGIKPLFYHKSQKTFSFASEIKSLFEAPWIEKRPNNTAIRQYFSLKNIPRPETAFKDIFELLPGHSLTFDLDSGECLESKYWEPTIDIDHSKSRDEWVHDIRAMFEDSVSSHTESDVEYGAFLSGGIDSSAVSSFLSQSRTTPLKTFTLTYEDVSSGKTRDQVLAEMISKQIGSEHVECLLRPQLMVEQIDRIADSFDEPFSGVFSGYFLAEEISKHVKVALSGDGADEIFGSYFLHRIANDLDSAIKGSKSAEDKLRSYGLNEDTLIALKICKNQRQMRDQWGVWTKSELISILNQDFFDGTTSSIDSPQDSLFSSDSLNETLLFDTRNLLPNQVLTFVDRLSMAHSLEVRPPFLDHRFVELAFKVPGKYKIEGTRVKSVLKDALSAYLPPEVVDRPKEGFVLPVNQWFQSELKDWSLEQISDSQFTQDCPIDRAAMVELLNSHKDNINEYGKRLLNIIMFLRWWNQHFS